MAQIMVQSVIEINDKLIETMIQEALRNKKIIESKWLALYKVFSIIKQSLYIIELDPNKKLIDFIENVTVCLFSILQQVHSLFTRNLLIKYLFILISFATVTPDISLTLFKQMSSLFKSMLTSNSNTTEIEGLYNYYLYFFSQNDIKIYDTNTKQIIQYIDETDIDDIRLFISKDRMVILLNESFGKSVCIVRNWSGIHMFKFGCKIKKETQYDGRWKECTIVVEPNENVEVNHYISEYLEKHSIPLLQSDKFAVTIKGNNPSSNETINESNEKTLLKELREEVDWKNDTQSSLLYNIIKDVNEKCLIISKEQMKQLFPINEYHTKIRIHCAIINERYDEIMKSLKPKETKTFFDEFLQTKITFTNNSFVAMKTHDLCEFIFTNEPSQTTKNQINSSNEMKDQINEDEIQCYIYVNTKEKRQKGKLIVSVKEMINGICVASIEKNDNQIVQTSHKHLYSIIASIEREIVDYMIEMKIGFLFKDIDEIVRINHMNSLQQTNALEGSLFSYSFLSKRMNQ